MKKYLLATALVLTCTPAFSDWKKDAWADIQASKKLHAEVLVELAAERDAERAAEHAVAQEARKKLLQGSLLKDGK